MTNKKRYSQPLLIPVIASLCGAGWFAAGIPYSPAVLLATLIMMLPLAMHAHYACSADLKKTVVFFITFLTVALTTQSAALEFSRLHTIHFAQKPSLTGIVGTVSIEGKKQKITLKNIHLTAAEKPQKMNWIASAYVFCPLDLLVAQNATIALTNLKLNKPPRDLTSYLLKEHSLGFFFPKKNDVQVLTTSPATLSWLDAKKSTLNRLITTTFSRTTAQHIQSIFLGQSTMLKTSTRTLFEWWGISHYLARSGLHLVVLVVLVTLLLNAFVLPLTLVRILTIAVVMLYHLLTMPSISFLRALMMNFAFAGAFLAGTTPNTLHIFLAVTLVTVLINPFVVFYADFQLSFGISGALIFVFNKMQQFSA